MAPRKRNGRPTASLKAIFAGKVFVLSGDFGEKIAHADIEKYIVLRGGSVQKEVTAETQFLVCTMANYKKDVAHVKAARRLGVNRCKIVSWDFLEDCMHASSLKGRWLDPRDYQLSRVATRVRDGKMEQVRLKIQFENQGHDFARLADPKLYIIYIDQAYLQYKIILTRLMLQKNKAYKIDKFTIYLFESNALPRLYKVGAKYTTKGKATQWLGEGYFDKPFFDAFKEFKALFKEKTGDEWDGRCDGLKLNPPYFRYVLPLDRKPVGILPLGCATPTSASKSKSDLVTSKDARSSISGDGKQ
ncbi:MAG: hypothetical protein M1818_004137 [Claussenomyces sp. TS43310]|nr:MAG: hypothetical protein M1818_004137 [Claussenomyces sp. TS43310]